jgi:hypothetical protein
MFNVFVQIVLPLIGGEVYLYFFRNESIGIPPEAITSSVDTNLDDSFESSTFIEIYNTDEITRTYFESIYNFFISCCTEICASNILLVFLNKPSGQLFLSLVNIIVLVPSIFFITQPNIISFLSRMVADPLVALWVIYDMSFSFFFLPIIDILSYGLIYFITKISVLYANYSYYLKFLYGLRYLSLWVWGYSYICFSVFSFLFKI